jgi:hypothetical protein
LFSWQAIIGNTKFWDTLEVLVAMLEPMVRTLRTFESNGWAPGKDGGPGHEVLLSSVMPSLTKMQSEIISACPSEWVPSVAAAVSATMQKGITDAHVSPPSTIRLFVVRAA